ncbi:hypothetical protein PFISCL1PPCAC_3800, partial [Pristionchus fissidentatus]
DQEKCENCAESQGDVPIHFIDSPCHQTVMEVVDTFPLRQIYCSCQRQHDREAHLHVQHMAALVDVV